MTTFAERQAVQWVAKGNNVAERLRDIADEVEREVNKGPNHVDAPEYSWKAQQVIHAVLWGVANLDLDGLALRAGDVDRLAGQGDHGGD